MSATFQRPKPVEIDDREEAQATLESLLEEDSDVTWVQFNYSIVRGGAGLARTAEEAQVKGVERNLSTLTLEEVGSGGVDELRKQLPPHEIAYVVYNNGKGSKREDEMHKIMKHQEGTRWKNWFQLRVRETARWLREHIHDWAALIEAEAQAQECQRLLKVVQELNIYVSPEVPMHNPIKMIEFLCAASPNLNGVYVRSLERLFDGTEDAAYTALQATGEVAQHLDKMLVKKHAQKEEAERIRQDKIRQRRAALTRRATIVANQKAAADRHAAKMSRRRGGAGAPADTSKTKELDLDVLEQGSVLSMESSRRSETELTERTSNFSDDFEDDSQWEIESQWDARSIVSKAESPLQSPLARSMRSSSRQLTQPGGDSPDSQLRRRTGESPSTHALQRGESTGLSRLKMELPEETGSVVSASQMSMETATVEGMAREPSMIDDLANMEWDDDEYEEKEDDDDAYFQWTIEEEAQRLAIVMEQCAHKMQALARGYRDRQRVRAIKKGINQYWSTQHLKARYHNVVVVIVWCPESTSMKMRELPLYHVREVIDLLNDASAAANEARESKLALEAPKGSTQHDFTAEQIQARANSDNNLSHMASIGNELLDSIVPSQRRKHSAPLIPHVVQKAKNLLQASPLSVANTVAINYFGGSSLSDDSDVEDEDFVVQFDEQKLYEDLLHKYSSILEVQGISRDDSDEKRRAWAERLETTSLRMARAAHRAQREILKRRKLLAGKGRKSCRHKSRMVLQDTNDSKDACEAAILVSTPGLEDLKHKFACKPWWTLTFPTRERPEYVADWEPEAAVDLNASEEDALENLQSMALSRVSQVSRTSSSHSSGRSSINNHSQTDAVRGSIPAAVEREPSLKSCAVSCSTFSTLAVSEFKELYLVKCAAMHINVRQENLQGFMHTIAKGCNDTCFNLVDVGLEASSIHFLLKCLSNRVITLTELNLARNPIGDKGATALSEFLTKNRTLTNLNLQSAQIGPAGQQRLFSVLQTQNFRIVTLDLDSSGTPMKNVCGEQGALAAGAAVRANTTLSVLSMAGTRLTAPQMQAFSKGLAKNIQLTKLDLSNNVFGDDGVCALATALETLQLLELKLSHTEMSDRGACALAHALSSCRPPIHSLWLSGNKIAAGGAAALASVISHKNTVLTTLKIDHNKLGPAGMKNFLEKTTFATETVKDKYGRPVDIVVRYPRVLTDLNLSSNGLSDRGAHLVAEMIKENSILTKLDLSHNGIGNRGVAEIGKALQSNSTLVNLALGWNSFSNAGLASFVENSEFCGHLVRLDFSGNPLTEGVGACLYSFLMLCTALTQLDMDHTFLTHDENEALNGVLERNISMLPKDPTVKMRKELEELEQRALIADELQLKLQAEKKALFQLNSKIEMLRSSTKQKREDTINDYIRITNSIAQGKIRQQACDHQIKQIDRVIHQSATEVGKVMAARHRKLDAGNEGKAWQLALKKNCEVEHQTVRDGERTQMQHLLHDLDSLCDKKEFCIKKHQKFRKDILELLKTSERFFQASVADNSWSLLDNDPTLHAEEILQTQRSSIANRLLALETREHNKEGMQRAARRATVMIKYAESARKDHESQEHPLSRLRALFCQPETAEDKTKKLIRRMKGLRSRSNSINKGRLERSQSIDSSLSRTSSASSMISTATSIYSLAPSSKAKTRASIHDLEPPTLSRRTSQDLAGMTIPRELSGDLPPSPFTSFSRVGSGASMTSCLVSPITYFREAPELGDSHLRRQLTGIMEQDDFEPQQKARKMSLAKSKSPSTKKGSWFGDGDSITEHSLDVVAELKSPSKELLSKKASPNKNKGKPKSSRASSPKLPTISVATPALPSSVGAVTLQSTPIGAVKLQSPPSVDPAGDQAVQHQLNTASQKLNDAAFRPNTAPQAAVNTAKSSTPKQKANAKGKRDTADKSSTVRPPSADMSANELGLTEGVFARDDAAGSVDGSGGANLLAAAAALHVVRREGPKSEGMGGTGSVRMLLKAGGQVDQTVLRGLLDVQQRFLNRVNYEKGAWMTALEEQQELRRPLAVGFMEARRIRNLAQLQEALGQQTKDTPSFLQGAGQKEGTGSGVAPHGSHLSPVPAVGKDKKVKKPLKEKKEKKEREKEKK